MNRISDGFHFARAGRVLAGEIRVADLERLQDLLASAEGDIRFRVEGLVGDRQEALLQIEIEGAVQLACQRCLEPLSHEIRVVSLLELVPEGAEFSQDELEDDTRDFLPVAKEVVVDELVEDEILLSLPVAPRHEKCGLPGGGSAGERDNPFASLATLKSKLN